MPHINLLPWREERRELRRKQFLTMLALVVLVGAFAVIATQRFYASAIEGQVQRNDYLRQNIAVLNQRVKEIKDLEKRRDQLLERMRIIQNLQGQRPLIVRIFDQQVRTLPDGVFFRSLTLNESTISVDGIAESNNRISSLMRRLDASQLFSSPNLTAVTGIEGYGEQGSSFRLSFKVVTENPDEDD